MNRIFKVILPVGIALGFAGALNSSLQSAPAKAKSSKIAAPKVAAKGQETATFAAGCFWSLDAIFKQLKGVSSVEPGYAGGKLKNPTYEKVGGGDTGHAETVNIVFDPKIISYRDLVEVLFTVHDPTTLNAQGNDVGTQYRSEIFARSPEQKQTALEVIKKLDAAKTFSAPIVTKVSNFSDFYRAEDYHLDYYNQNPKTGYCAMIVGPKVEKFKTKFKDKLKN